MNATHIILKTHKEDSFSLDLGNVEKSITINLNALDNETLVAEKVFELLKTNQVTLSTAMWDLLKIGLFVYTTDQLVSRRHQGYLSWSRHFICHVPVLNPELWTRNKPIIEKMLSFLTGDFWAFNFRRDNLNVYKPYSPKNPLKITNACLLSGGLDSFIGAIDLLEAKEKIAFVSHYKRGGAESKTQNEIVTAFETSYGKNSFKHFQFYVQPMHRKGIEKENSSRGRSFLFICLGLAVAHSFGENIPLIIPENGFISLNVPLTSTRLGSNSTRTTHPFYLHTFQKLLTELGILNTLDNPYLYCTKGEMINNCKNLNLFKEHFQNTVSCSHPDVMRLEGDKPNQHCGYCVPCLIRRAALTKNGLRDAYYFKDVLQDAIPANQKRSSDLRAFKLAIQETNSMNQRQLLFHVLRSGPLSFLGQSSLEKCVSMYQNGIGEVASFINNV